MSANDKEEEEEIGKGYTEYEGNKRKA